MKIVCVMDAGKANAKHALARRRMVAMLKGDSSLYLYLHAKPQIAQLSQRVGSWVPCDLAHLRLVRRHHASGTRKTGRTGRRSHCFASAGRQAVRRWHSLIEAEGKCFFLTKAVQGWDC